MTELIETLWNVNVHPLQNTEFSVHELIETLWNVNFVLIKAENHETERINRNIVECKCGLVR